MFESRRGGRVFVLDLLVIFADFDRHLEPGGHVRMQVERTKSTKIMSKYVKYVGGKPEKADGVLD